MSYHTNMDVSCLFLPEKFSNVGEEEEVKGKVIFFYVLH
jgi:hypothetical protein